MPTPPPYRPNLPFVLAGCVAVCFFTAARIWSVQTSHPTPTTVIYTHAPAAGVLTGVAALCSLTAAVDIARAPIGRFRLAALLPAFLALGAGLLTDDGFRSHLTLTPTSAALPAAGFLRAHPTVEFADVGYATLREKEMEFVQKDGTRLTFPRGTLLRAALPELQQRLADAGIVVLLRP